MPAPVPWMTRTDRYILDLLDQAGIAVPPKVIWTNLRDRHGEAAPSRRQIARRLGNELFHHGLVCQPFADEARGLYALTDLGERFCQDPTADPREFVAELNASE